MMTREERIALLKQHVPFLNPLFIPIVEERLETKAKFTELEDRLLMMIVASDHKDYPKLRAIFFPDRPEHQIKNRIKNLCGNGREVSNAIKEMKLNSYQALTAEELDLLVEAFGRFGSRWPVIARYYQLRSADFLEQEYSQSEKLQRKRAKEQVQTGYRSLKELLELRLQHLAQRLTLNKKEDEQEEHDHEPVYKVINLLTFMVEEI